MKLLQITLIALRRQQGPGVKRFTLINWIRCIMKSTWLIPHQTVLQHQSIIKFLHPLFVQVGQLRTNSYLQWWPGTSFCKVNRHVVEQRAATTFPVIRFNTKQSGSALPSNVSPNHSPQPYTQVKNNLSWLPGGFAQKYWAILIKLSASHLREKIWHLKWRESSAWITISNLSFHLQASAFEENLSNIFAHPKRRLMENGISLLLLDTDLVSHANYIRLMQDHTLILCADKVSTHTLSLSLPPFAFIHTYTCPTG